MGQAHPPRMFFLFFCIFPWCFLSLLGDVMGKKEKRGYLTITARAGSRPEKGIPVLKSAAVL